MKMQIAQCVGFDAANGLFLAQIRAKTLLSPLLLTIKTF
jgi:hypothetical protein